MVIVRKLQHIKGINPYMAEWSKMTRLCCLLAIFVSYITLFCIPAVPKKYGLHLIAYHRQHSTIQIEGYISHRLHTYMFRPQYDHKQLAITQRLGLEKQVDNAFLKEHNRMAAFQWISCASCLNV